MIKDIEERLEMHKYMKTLCNAPQPLHLDIIDKYETDVECLLSLVKKQREVIKEFTDKYHYAGSISVVDYADIYKLREVLKEELIQDKESITTIQRMTIEESKKRYPDHIFFTGKEE